MYYRISIKSISGYHHFDLYGPEEYETALEVVSAHYSYFNEHHPGDLEECYIKFCAHDCDPILIKDFLQGE